MGSESNPALALPDIVLGQPVIYETFNLRILNSRYNVAQLVRVCPNTVPKGVKLVFVAIDADIAKELVLAAVLVRFTYPTKLTTGAKGTPMLFGTAATLPVLGLTLFFPLLGIVGSFGCCPVAAGFGGLAGVFGLPDFSARLLFLVMPLGLSVHLA